MIPIDNASIRHLRYSLLLLSFVTSYRSYCYCVNSSADQTWSAKIRNTTNSNESTCTPRSPNISTILSNTFTITRFSSLFLSVCVGQSYTDLRYIILSLTPPPIPSCNLSHTHTHSRALSPSIWSFQGKYNCIFLFRWRINRTLPIESFCIAYACTHFVWCVSVSVSTFIHISNPYNSFTQILARVLSNIHILPTIRIPLRWTQHLMIFNFSFVSISRSPAHSLDMKLHIVIGFVLHSLCVWIEWYTYMV